MIIINETLNNGYNIQILTFLSILSILLGVSVIIIKNPVISVLFLIGLFFGISLYLMMTGLYFIGLSYLLVYVGAVSILFLFILMLINVRISELVTDAKNSLLLSIITILLVSFSFNKLLPDLLYTLSFYFDLSIKNFIYTNMVNITSNVANVYSSYWDNAILEVSHISGIGNILYTNLFIFLIITSLILLLVMIGCIVITIKRT